MTTAIKQLGNSTRSSSEYFTKKYDDIEREERLILTKMLERPNNTWNFNEFRNIATLGNDGKAISTLLSGLVNKQYIRKNNNGWILREN